MPLGKFNIFGNQQAMPLQNQNFQQPTATGQFGRSNYTPTLMRGLQKFMPMMGGMGGFPLPLGLNQNYGRSAEEGLPGAQGMYRGNPGWGAGPQSAGGQGYATPGYPPQGFGQQLPQQPMPPAQGYPSQGYPPQNYSPQGFNQGYGGQMSVQPAWEEPKKGGIKGFISNLMAKRKR